MFVCLVYIVYLCSIQNEENMKTISRNNNQAMSNIKIGDKIEMGAATPGWSYENLVVVGIRTTKAGRIEVNYSGQVIDASGVSHTFNGFTGVKSPNSLFFGY